MIGVFDSGVGGLTILKKIIEDNKEYNYIYYKDTYNNPYGGRSIEDLNNICSNICDYLIKKGAKIIVIACGTASTNCLSYLENKYKNIKFIPTYPNLEGNYKNTLVLATHNTIKSKYLHDAIKDKEGNYYLEEMPGLADAIEHDDRISIKLILRDKLNKYHKPTEIQYALKNFNLLIRQLKEEIKRHKNQIHSSKLEYVINSHLEIIESLDKKIKETEEEILKLVEQSELKQHFDNLLTIPCIGTQTALQILTVLCSKHFVTANGFIAYAGLSPSIFESGTSVKKPDKLSRLGNLQLKSSLFMPALGAMRTHYFKDFVDRLESNGKQRKVIVGALMRKLLKLAYYIYMTNKPFNPNYKY